MCLLTLLRFAPRDKKKKLTEKLFIKPVRLETGKGCWYNEDLGEFGMTLMKVLMSDQPVTQTRGIEISRAVV